jgi:hypothetical protein
VPAGHDRVRLGGAKELIALAEGYRESAGSWADLPRDAKRRGMRAPVLAVGDGALGFWSALREVFAETREQRCWFHKIGNVLAALPKSAQPGAKKALAQIWNAEKGEHARRAAAAFKLAYQAKFPTPSPRSPTISTSCWPATTSRPSTGRTYVPPTPSLSVVLRPLFSMCSTDVYLAGICLMDVVICCPSNREILRRRDARHAGGDAGLGSGVVDGSG